MAHQTYRLPFGRHKGKTLQEAGSSYCGWMVRDKVYDDKPDLEAALLSAGYLRSGTATSPFAAPPVTYNSFAYTPAASPSRPRTPPQQYWGGQAPPTPPPSSRKPAVVKPQTATDINSVSGGYQPRNERSQSPASSPRKLQHRRKPSYTTEIFADDVESDGSQPIVSVAK